MRLGNLKDDNILEILGLAHQYGFEDLEAAISDYLRSILSIHNVCFIYDTASLYRLEHLVSSCCLFMDRHASDVIKHESFNTLSATGIKDILSRDSFCAAEVRRVRGFDSLFLSNIFKICQHSILPPIGSYLYCGARMDEGEPRHGGRGHSRLYPLLSPPIAHVYAGPA